MEKGRRRAGAADYHIGYILGLVEFVEPSVPEVTPLFICWREESCAEDADLIARSLLIT